MKENKFNFLRENFNADFAQQIGFMVLIILNIVACFAFGALIGSGLATMFLIVASLFFWSVLSYESNKKEKRKIVKISAFVVFMAYLGGQLSYSLALEGTYNAVDFAVLCGVFTGILAFCVYVVLYDWYKYGLGKKWQNLRQFFYVVGVWTIVVTTFLGVGSYAVCMLL